MGTAFRESYLVLAGHPPETLEPLSGEPMKGDPDHDRWKNGEARYARQNWRATVPAPATRSGSPPRSSPSPSLPPVFGCVATAVASHRWIWGTNRARREGSGSGKETERGSPFVVSTFSMPSGPVPRVRGDANHLEQESGACGRAQPRARSVASRPGTT